MLQDKCPGRLVWVLRQMEPEVWFNNQGINYNVQLKAPGMESITDKVGGDCRRLHASRGGRNY